MSGTGPGSLPFLLKLHMGHARFENCPFPFVASRGLVVRIRNLDLLLVVDDVVIVVGVPKKLSCKKVSYITAELGKIRTLKRLDQLSTLCMEWPSRRVRVVLFGFVGDTGSMASFMITPVALFRDPRPKKAIPTEFQRGSIRLLPGASIHWPEHRATGFFASEGSV